MKAFPFFTALVVLSAGTAIAQVRIQTGDANVSIGGDGGVSVRTDRENINVRSKGKGTAAIATEGNTAGNTVGGIEGDVDSEGVTIINGRVYIDGKEIPPKVTRYKSPRTGEVYTIRRKGSSVEVTSDQEGK